MKILLFGDSITDMCRNRELNKPSDIWSYGNGYPFFIAGNLYKEDPNKYQVINRGIGGNRIVDLYARIKCDVWNIQPDVLSILIGINDIWHEIANSNGVELERFERVYKSLIEDTLKVLPNVKIILCEPFVLLGYETCNTAENPNRFKQFLKVKNYATVVKKLADKYNLYFLPLQEKFDKMAEKYGAEQFLYDGVHPMIAGAKLIADEWIDLFKNKIEK
ncbi:MAG: SGNH/GDSL hydrolase family protein [Clostridia bacterium]|nr:SGNH/GDSL hydrolase family protein [Clostridia bacterium]